MYNNNLSSPIKNHAVAYDHDRKKLLSEIDKKRIALKPEGIFRNPAN